MSDFKELISFVSTLIAIIVFAISLYRWFHRMETRLINLECELEHTLKSLIDKVDVLWSFTFRRAVSEAVIENYATLKPDALQTPGLSVNDLVTPHHILEWFEPLKSKLQEIVKLLPPETTDEDISLVIEKNLGDELLRMVCIPKGMSKGACLLIATQVARR